MRNQNFFKKLAVTAMAAVFVGTALPLSGTAHAISVGDIFDRVGLKVPKKVTTVRSTPVENATGSTQTPTKPAQPVTTTQPATGQTSTPSTLQAKREKVVQTAISLKDRVKYAHWSQRDETGPIIKTDCSGYTYLVYKLANVGVTLVNRDDDAQAKVGQKVAWGQFEKGDLLFFWIDKPGDVGHVGIYIGDNKIIHNFGYKNNVVISTLNSEYKKRFMVARRVLY
ncbi:C40 family peptidase [Staphylospora marina]|uniref:C40 family peptidase n=1 Tax=Staphylospora marina TaxID=2490858 RepID=UPI000F5BD48E|nr:NlpC/P60 family protein [Staphylospora marina]